jgi:hypothetical protein
VGQERLGPSYFFIPLVLDPLNSLVWWEVPLGYIALGSFLFLQEQIKDIIIIVAAPVHAPSLAPLLLPFLLSHNLPLPRVH